MIKLLLPTLNSFRVATLIKENREPITKPTMSEFIKLGSDNQEVLKIVAVKDTTINIPTPTKIMCVYFFI
jgi:hypothetical protein